MIGILVVDKPSGLTSHDVVDAARRLTGVRRIGHTGTLDPMATGVLVLLVGPATRLAQFAMKGPKEYQASIRLGVSTTTYDAEGEVTSEGSVNVDVDLLRQTLATFHGEIMQIPPMYSAIRVNGRRLYEAARRGEYVERKPRRVTIEEIEILKWDPPNLALRIRCSPGTYIRSLAHDLGELLGCGAHLTALRRTVSGPFTLDHSHTLDELEELQRAGRLREALLPPSTALSHMPVAVLSPDQARKVRHGQTITIADADAPLVQGVDLQGCLLAVLIRLEAHTYRPKVVLPPCHETPSGRGEGAFDD